MKIDPENIIYLLLKEKKSFARTHQITSLLKLVSKFQVLSDEPASHPNDLRFHKSLKVAKCHQVDFGITRILDSLVT